MQPSTTEPAVIAYVGLGANLGDTVDTLRAAIAAIALLPQTRLVATSPLYRTAPIDASGPDYTNAVTSIATRLRAVELLVCLQGIEQAHGRERPFVNAPRSLDLDLLLYGDEVIQLPQLHVPHPRLHERAFVLRPLADLAPDLVVAGQGSLRHLLARVGGQRLEIIEP
jgi:2-amino-4-hydroxy-6-hydroxymethyldihydropteridine diphosphokinase